MGLKAIISSKMMESGKGEKTQKEIMKELDKLGKAIKHDLEKTTATWDTKVDFRVEVGIQGNGAYVAAGTDNVIFNYVSGGTRPHLITPKRSKFLVFRSGFTPKTSPRTIKVGQGSSSGPLVRAKAVKHPGTKARRFEAKILVRYQDVLPGVMQAAVNRALGI